MRAMRAMTRVTKVTSRIMDMTGTMAMTMAKTEAEDKTMTMGKKIERSGNMGMQKSGKSGVLTGFLMAFVLGIGLLCGAGMARADGFMSAFEEIPLQQGFDEEEAMTFDTEEIRIVEQYITSTVVSRAEFLKFYKETLKSLGWEFKGEKKDVYSFIREDEMLTLTVESDDPLVVLFTLKPQGM